MIMNMTGSMKNVDHHEKICTVLKFIGFLFSYKLSVHYKYYIEIDLNQNRIQH